MQEQQGCEMAGMMPAAEAQAKLDVLMDAAARETPQFIRRAQGAERERFVLLRADTLGQMLAGNLAVHLSRERGGSYIAQADGFPVIETGRTPDEAKRNSAEGLPDSARLLPHHLHRRGPPAGRAQDPGRMGEPSSAPCALAMRGRFARP